MLIVEDISLAPGIKKPSDYHFHAKTLLQNSNMDTEFPRSPFNRKTDAFELEALPINLKINGLEIKQDYYTLIKGKYSLNFTLSYITEEQKLMLENILSTLKPTQI